MTASALQVAAIANALAACDKYVSKEVATDSGTLEDGTPYDIGDTILVMTDGCRVCIPKKKGGPDQIDNIYQSGELVPADVECGDDLLLEGSIVPAGVVIFFDGDEAICITETDTPYVPLKELYKPGEALPGNMDGTVQGYLDDGYYDDGRYVNGTLVTLGANDLIPINFNGGIQVDEIDGCAVCIPGKPPELDLQTRLNQAQGHKCAHVYAYDLEIITAPITIPEGVVLHGGCIQVNATMSTAITVESCAGLEHVCVSCNSNVTNRVVYSSATEGSFVRESTFTGENNADVIYFQNTTNSEIIENETSSGWNAIVARDALSDVRIERNELQDWRQRGIFVFTDVGTERVHIIGNIVHPHRPATPSPKQPIGVQSPTSGPHRFIKINRNCVRGLENHETGAQQNQANGNTSDNISLQRGQDFEIKDNMSMWGGELGISCTIQSRRGFIHGNLAAYNDVAGISCGAVGGGPADRCADLIFTCNTAYNNGRIVDQNIGINNSAGLWIDLTDNAVSKGNVSYDDGIGWQRHGLRIRNSTNVQHDNCYYGNYDTANPDVFSN